MRNVIEPLESRTLLSDATDWVSEDIIGSYGGGCNEIAVAGRYAYLCCGLHLQIYDIADPVQPMPLSSMLFNGMTVDVAVEGDFAYVADAGGATGDMGTLSVIDVSDPKAPKRVAQLSTPSHATKIELAGSFAYVSDYSSGLHIFDITNPADPHVAGVFPINNHEVVAHVAGNYAYAAAMGSPFQVIDLTDPTAPVLLGSCPLPVATPMPRDIAVSNGLAYVTDYYGRLIIVDVSKPAAPRLRSSTPLRNPLYDITISDALAYIASSDGMKIFDISDPDNPSPIASWASEVPLQHDGLQLVGSRVYLSDYLGGFDIIDVADPADPKTLGRYHDTGGGMTVDVDVSGDRAYVANSRLGLQIFDVSDPASPRRLGVYACEAASKVNVVGTIAYLVTQFPTYGELHILDVSDPAAIELLDKYSTGTIPSAPMEPYNYIQFVGNLAYLSGRYDPGIIHVVSVADPAHPTPITSFSAGATSIGKFEVVGSLLYVAAGASGLQTFDISDPYDPQLLSQYVPSPRLQDPPPMLSVTTVDVQGHFAYIGGYGFNFEILDISDPAAPILVHRQAEGHTIRLCVVDDIAYLLHNYFTLQVLDVSDPSAPQERGSLTRVMASPWFLPKDDLIYLADQSLGFVIIRVTPTEQLLATGNTTVPIATSRDLFSLTLTDSATVALTPGAHALVRTPSLRIRDSATLDLADNALVIACTSDMDLRDKTLASVVSLIRSKRLTSSLKGPYTTLAATLNDKGNQSPILQSLFGQSLSATDILVKYTYNGDANLDGIVNADDYFLIDSGYVTQAKGWFNGDFNYDGIINADDYFMIDSAYVGQAGSLGVQELQSCRVAEMGKRDETVGVVEGLFGDMPIY